MRPLQLLHLQKPNMLIHHRPTHPTNPNQLTAIQRPLLIRRIMPQKSTRQILNRNLRPPNALPHGPSFFIPDRTRIRIMDNSVSGGGYDCLHGLYPKRLGRHGSRPYGFTNYDMPLKTKTHRMNLFSKQKRHKL